MSFEDLAEHLAARLNAKYDNYDVRAARARLVDRILQEAAEWRAPDGPAHPSTRDAAGLDPTADDWWLRGSCRDGESGSLLVPGAGQRGAKVVCLGCPVRVECLAEALDERAEVGVWGGMTDRERRALLRRRPDVTSWRDLLSQAVQEYEVERSDETAEAGGSAERTAG